jgi:hypothetical protein
MLRIKPNRGCSGKPHHNRHSIITLASTTSAVVLSKGASANAYRDVARGNRSSNFPRHSPRPFPLPGPNPRSIRDLRALVSFTFQRQRTNFISVSGRDLLCRWWRHGAMTGRDTTLHSPVSPGQRDERRHGQTHFAFGAELGRGGMWAGLLSLAAPMTPSASGEEKYDAAIDWHLSDMSQMDWRNFLTSELHHL